MTQERFLEIIDIMISWGMLDKSRLLDKEYVVNRVASYIKAKEFVDNNFKRILIMERKSIQRKFEVSTSGSCYLNYDFFINNLTSVRNTIKEKYPEVKDKDIEIEFEYDDAWDETHIALMFSSLETDEEQNRRLNNEEKQREREKGKMMDEIQSYLKLYPELKEELLNS